MAASLLPSEEAAFVVGTIQQRRLQHCSNLCGAARFERQAGTDAVHVSTSAHRRQSDVWPDYSVGCLRESLLRPAARWRIGSRNARATCSPTGPRPPPCAPTSSDCGSPPSPTLSSARSGALTPRPVSMEAKRGLAGSSRRSASRHGGSPGFPLLGKPRVYFCCVIRRIIPRSRAARQRVLRTFWPPPARMVL